MSEGWRGGSTRQWRKVRAVVLDRNQRESGGRCQLAYPGEWHVIVRALGGGGRQAVETRRCGGVATQVHHLLGKAITGDDPRYLRAVCRPCNLKAGDPTIAPDPPTRARTQWV